MREVFLRAGATVKWNKETQEVTAVIGDRTIVHMPLKNEVIINGTAIKISPSFMHKNNIMLPLRSIAGITGFGMKWEAAKGPSICRREG